MMQLTSPLGDEFALAETDYRIWRAQIWDRGGALIASARQTRRVLG